MDNLTVTLPRKFLARQVATDLACCVYAKDTGIISYAEKYVNSLRSETGVADVINVPVKPNDPIIDLFKYGHTDAGDTLYFAFDIERIDIHNPEITDTEILALCDTLRIIHTFLYEHDGVRVQVPLGID